jgi:hypothetical protein
MVVENRQLRRTVMGLNNATTNRRIVGFDPLHPASLTHVFIPD